jgi:hypothetical protein
VCGCGYPSSNLSCFSRDANSVSKEKQHLSGVVDVVNNKSMRVQNFRQIKKSNISSMGDDWEIINHFK